MVKDLKRTRLYDDANVGAVVMETIRYKRQLQAGLLSGSASIRSQYQPIRPEVKPQNVVFSDQKRIVNTPESKYL